MSDGVTISPAGTSHILADQLDTMRVEARVAMKEATGLAHREMSHLTRGRISEHIAEKVTGGPGAVNGRVFPTDDFAKYVDEGTGLYVEHHHPITPKAARMAGTRRAALKFADGRIRRSSRGQRPQHFVRRAEDAVEQQVAATLERAGDRVIGEL